MSAPGAHVRRSSASGGIALLMSFALQGGLLGCSEGVDDASESSREEDAGKKPRRRPLASEDASSRSVDAAPVTEPAREDAGVDDAAAPPPRPRPSDAGAPSRPRPRGDEPDASVSPREEPEDAGRPEVDSMPDADLVEALDAGEHVDAGAPESTRDAATDASVPVPDAGLPGQDAALPLAIDAGQVVGVPRVADTHALAEYALVGAPRELPELSDNASDVAWRPETDTFFVVENGAARLHEFNASFTVNLRTIELEDGSTDTEGLAYLGGGRFAISVEEDEVYVFTLADGADSVDLNSSAVQRYVVSDPPETINRGFEGVAYRADSSRFFVAEEGGDPDVPKRILAFDARNDGTTFEFDDDLVVSEPFDAEDAFQDLASDLSGLHFDLAAANLLVLSDESRRLLRVVPETGNVLEERAFTTSMQYEGVTLADQHRLVLVSEPNTVEVYRAE